MPGIPLIRRALLVTLALPVLMACGGAPDTEQAARQACVDAVGGRATESTFDDGTATVLGFDEGGRAWTCHARWSDGDWTAAIRPGHP
ncbi:hypothetical protein [Geodermatophilus ruber]|uniref:Uncharacterized protein n=1 Tax=Geodermatophilus ruber TaxID=504800 RepID=A0A1I4HAJ1_9ACTN|nr:hypothetical protein [Geodermatophilus ruber]SFL39234.1 hypothetical protein SAMN04488085_110112 [Geodermatophilus ruber]